MNSKGTLAELLIGGLVRTLLSALGGVLSAKGIMLDQSLVEALSGIAVVVIMYLWSAANKSKVVTWMKTAIRLPAHSTVAEVKAAAKETHTAANVPL